MSQQNDGKGKLLPEHGSKQPVNTIIQTHGQRILGKILIRVGDRVIDELNRAEQFLAVTDATVYDLEGDVLYRCNFVSINRQHIIWLIPEDNPQPSVEKGRASE